MKLCLLFGLLCFVTIAGGQLWNYNNYRSCSYCYPYGGYRGYGGYGYSGYNYLSPLTTNYPYGYSSTSGLGGMCRDRSPNCAYLVAMGQCATNPIATRSMCPISCGTGCGGIGTTGLGLGVGTMDALADGGLYSNSLLYNTLSPYTGIYRKEPADRVPQRPLEKF